MISPLNVDKLRLDMGDYVLSVQALYKRLGTRQVLAGADLDVKRGTCAALVGPAGAGKSVMLACIGGALRPNRGRIRYFGYEIKGRPEVRVVRMGVARTHQSPQNFRGMSVLEAVTVGALLRHKGLSRARTHAREVLALTGLADLADVTIEALDAGVQRRAEIARALATDPQLLLLDEPIAGLGLRDTAGIIAVIAALRARGLTVVTATRSLDLLAEHVDSVVELDGGSTKRRGAYATADFRV